MSYFLRMTTDLKESVMRIIQERNRREDEEEFQKFCEELLSLPEDLELVPKKNFKADIELQPLRWMNLGIDLLKSRRVTGHIQLADGIEGPETDSYLPYPVFQMATEIFLKGMWLCKYAECRELLDSSYVDSTGRTKYHDKLGSKGLGHDLLKIVNAVREIPAYQTDTPTMRFLELVERIIRVFYFPPYEADKRSRWADNRYPKRVYDDTARRAQAESFQSYPRAEWIEKLFRKMEEDADRLWNLRSELSLKRKSTL